MVPSAKISSRSRNVDGTRIKGMPRWLNSTSIVLRSQMARIARLHSWFDIVHTSLEIFANETMETTELSVSKSFPFDSERKYSSKERHSRCGEWPLRM